MKEVTVKKLKKTIDTYIPKKAHELPMFFENKPYQGASGRLYPLPYSDGISDDKTAVDYDVFVLENEYVKTEVLPQIGGKILSGLDKTNGYDFIYRNEVVKPALVGLAGPWISGGIEFNFPQHHRPTTYMPLEAAAEENEDGGKTVWTGEVEPFNRMKGMAGITLDKGRSYIKAKVQIYNRTSLPQIFMWWANLAVSVNDDYRTVFPPDVEWVNDHDRRAVLEWPVAKGLYKTARPFNYGDGTDISKYASVLVPSSFLVSQGQSDMDFIAGYDEKLDRGIVTVADHHISPGKKLWTWGKGDFGDMWCSNLTDRNGPYIELMTGVYTDNQPDFTWIAPFESRRFEQYWYPVKGIGGVKNATINAAVNVTKHGEKADFGFVATGVFKNCTVEVSANGKQLFKEKVDMSPERAYKNTVGLDGCDFYELRFSLIDESGNVLVSYKPYKKQGKKPIDARKPVKRPSEIENSEELYINALHLEQYKQHNYNAADYYKEGVRRDKYDIRCNTGLARLSLKNGSFARCIRYADNAISRLTLRNQHPSDTEALYLKGVALKYLGKNDEAYEMLQMAAWSYGYRSAAMQEIANIDCLNRDYCAALGHIDSSLEGNAHNARALVLKAVILRKLGNDVAAKELLKNAVSDDMLDMFALNELSHYENAAVQRTAEFFYKPENVIDLLCNYISAGFYEDALELIESAHSEYPLIWYYKAYVSAKLKKEFKSDLKYAESIATGYCFPARLEDIAVLEFAIGNDENASNAHYYLGCLLYDRFDYSKAMEHFENCVKLNSAHWKAWRNMAFGYAEKLLKPRNALKCMQTALKLEPCNARLLLEYQQLLKSQNASPEKRLCVYNEYNELMMQRDDCILDKIILLSSIGEYKAAIDLAASKRFHIYEGGEGKLTKQHAWMFVLYANSLLKSGDKAAAEKAYLGGVDVPKSYGEAKTYFNQEAHIYYFLGRLYESENQEKQAKTAYEKAAEYKAAVSEISMFRALALKKLGNENEAAEVANEMLETANGLIKNCDLRSYYGVGSPTPMPFENDIERNNLTDGYVLKAYALKALGENSAAKKALKSAEEINPFDFRIHAFREVEPLISD